MFFGKVGVCLLIFFCLVSVAVPNSMVDRESFEDFYARADRIMVRYHRSLKYNKERRELLKRSIIGAGLKYDIDVYLIFSVMGQESGFRNIMGQSGELGYMQVKRETAEFMHRIYRDPIPKDIEDALENSVPYNIDRGVAYLKYLRDTYSADDKWMLVLYNVGHGRVDWYAKPIIERAEELRGG